MSARRLFLGSVALVAIARVACGWADDPAREPILGSAEPIGKLLIVTAGFDDVTEPSSADPIPLVGPELLQPPTGSPFHGLIPPRAFSVTSVVPQPRAHVIEQSLMTAAAHLFAAGLTDDSQQVTAVLHQFQTRHRQRVLLAEKQAQLAALQAEVEQLKLRVEKGITSNQILLSVKIIEADADVAKELVEDSEQQTTTNPAAAQQTLSRLLASSEFHKRIEARRKNGAVRILGEPNLIVMSGRAARFLSGGKVATPQIAQAGGPVSMEFGTTVLATATIIDSDRIRVATTVEVKELDEASSVTVGGLDVPGIRRRSVRSTFELEDGQTIILGGLATSNEETTVVTLVAVTAEIVPQADEIAVPAAPPVEATFPMPTPTRSIKAPARSSSR